MVPLYEFVKMVAEKLSLNKIVIEILTSHLGFLYKRTFPFLNDVLQTDDERSLNLFLEMFSKQHESLFFVGGVEVSSAVFGLRSILL